MAVSWRLVATALVVAFGSSFQSGYFISLYNVPQDIIESYINESIHNRWHRILSPVEVSTVWAAIASSNQAGKVVAVFAAPIVADRIGRKWTLLLSSFLSIIGMLLQYLAQPTGLFLLLAVGRLITGIYNGVIGVIVPLYLVEIAVIPSWRGGVTRIHNVVTILGNILALLFGIPEILGTPTRWGYLALIPLPLVVFETFWLLAVPESPMYLLQSGKSEYEVKKSLRYYLGTSADAFEASARAAVAKKQKMMREGEERSGWWETIREIPKNPLLRKAFVLWMMLAFASSFSGGNITNNFLTSMVAGAGMKFSNFDKYASVTINSIKILVVLGALYIVDKFGRKPLLVSTMWAVMLCLVILAAIAYAQKAYMAISAYSATWARIVFLFLWTSIQYVVNSTATLIVSETALQKSRAMSLAVFKMGYHVSSVFLTFAWPPISRYSEGGGYLFLGVPYFFICIYLTLACPETKSIDLIGQEHTEKTPLLKTPSKDSGRSSRSKPLTPIASSRESLTDPEMQEVLKTSKQ